MSDMHDFSAGRDDKLGALLRAHFAAPDDAAFAARMRSAAIAAAAEGEWRSVARWTLPGLAAAAVLLAVLGAAFGSPTEQTATRNAASSAAGSLIELTSDSSPAGGTALLAVMSF